MYQAINHFHGSLYINNELAFIGFGKETGGEMWNESNFDADIKNPK